MRKDMQREEVCVATKEEAGAMHPQAKEFQGLPMAGRQTQEVAP